MIKSLYNMEEWEDILEFYHKTQKYNDARRKNFFWFNSPINLVFILQIIIIKT